MKFLTIRIDKNINEQHLYKDVGGIPYALAKYCNYVTNFVYYDFLQRIVDYKYEQYVKLTFIKHSSFKIINLFKFIKFILNESSEYNILNIYHGRALLLFVCFLAKLKNSNIKIYVKLDMNRNAYNKLLNDDKKNTLKYKFLTFLNKIVDLYTVETKVYVGGLNGIRKFGKKVKYLPNGFFSDLVDIDKNIQKEKIFLTVGRLGTESKNTEMIVSAIENIEPKKLKNWKVYLVGSMTDEFEKWFNVKLQEKPYLNDIFIITGSISDKKELYTLYAKSSVFVLTSRWEGFPLVLPEAMYFGCYPIVTNCFDAVTDIISKSFGKIIENENIHELQIAIEDVLDEKEAYIEKGKEASLYVQTNFNWHCIVNKLNEYLQVLK